MSERDKPSDETSGNPYADQLSAMTRTFTQLVERNQSLMGSFLDTSHRAMVPDADPMNVGSSFEKAGEKLSGDPQKLMQANHALWKEHMALWQEMALRVFREMPEGDDGGFGRDKRFRHEDWAKNPLFEYIRKSYQITSRWMMKTVAEIEGLDESDRAKVEFHTQLLVDSFAPTNFFATNPEALRTMVETNGESLVKGMRNLVRDLDPKTSQLNIMMTDPDGFRLGVDIATAPGKVVYQNDLVQLIQYAPTTTKVHARPLVIAPPWINKFYILDLQPKNSFIRWAVDAGYTVFVISWVNPDSELGGKTFEDYMQEGILDVLDAVERATGEREVSMIGYCIGGTLLSATLAWMAETGDDRIKAATFFASQADFSEAGDLKLFADEAQVAHLERLMEDKGYLEGSSMATTFNLLRANDLIWSFYVDNYLLGKEPAKFDLLYWNADSTRMPRETHLFYLRQCYIENNLAEARRHHAEGRADRSLEGDDPDLPAGGEGRSHRPLPVRVQVDRALRRPRPLHARGLGSHRRRHQPARGEEVPALDQRGPAERTSTPGSRAPSSTRARGGEDWDRWLKKHSGKKVDATRAGRRRARRHRGRTGELRCRPELTESSGPARRTVRRLARAPSAAGRAPVSRLVRESRRGRPLPSRPASGPRG